MCPRTVPGMARRDWNLRHCARSGHVHFSPDEPAGRAAARLVSAAGDELWLCLRCGGYFPAEAPESGPLHRAPQVARGAELRDRFVLRLLGTERFVRGALMLLAGGAAVLFRHAQAGWRSTFFDTLPLLRPVGARFGIDVDHDTFVRLAVRLLTVGSHTLLLVALALFGYGVTQLVEGVGLWLARRWAEYLSAVVTSAFLPLEGYELVDGWSWWKAATLALNVAAVVWLVVSKRLFGVRGGHAALLASRRETSVLPTA